MLAALVRRCREHCGAIAWSPRAPSCAGIAVSCARNGPIRTRLDGHRSTRRSRHVRHQGRRTARPTARGRRAPPHDSKTPPGLGRPGRPRRARPAAAPRAASPSPGHPGHDPALASPSHPQEVDLSEPARTPTDRRRARRIGRAGRQRTTRTGDTKESRASCSNSATGSAPRRSSGSSSATASHRHRYDTPKPAGGNSCAPRPPACSRSTSSTSTAR